MPPTDSQKLDRLVSTVDALFLMVSELLGTEKAMTIMDRIIEERKAQLTVVEMENYLAQEGNQHGQD